METKEVFEPVRHCDFYWTVLETWITSWDRSMPMDVWRRMLDVPLRLGARRPLVLP